MTCITPILPPKADSYLWTVPNLPTNAAVMDIRFGCEGWYPESYAPQPMSTFVIAKPDTGIAIRSNFTFTLARRHSDWRSSSAANFARSTSED